jgi:phage baseplate assembly protein W/3'-phosphoadenosine 5'-phosphosulfate sulfotransferase (PAPS reductase)/FAD synthetase
MFLKQSTAYTFRMGPFLDETDGKTAETGLTISQADVRLSKGGGNFAQKNESTSASHDEIGYYIVLLDATDTATVGELLVAVHESGALPVFKTFQVVEEAIYDAIYGGSANLITKVDAIDTVVDAILVDTGTTIPATIATVDTVVDAILVDTGTTLDGKINTIDTVVDSILVDTAVIGAAGAGLTGVPWNAAWDAEVQSECADALTAYDPPTKTELDSAFTEIKGGTWATTDTLEAIRDRGDAAWTTGGGGSAPTAAAVADAVWDEATSGHTSSGTFGATGGGGSAPTAAAVADAVWDEATSGHTTSGTFGEQVKTDIDAILVDTGTTIPATIATVDTVVDAILVDTGTTIPATIATVDTVVDAILVDTGTTLPATLDTIDNFLDTEIAAILADTNELQGDWANGGRLDLLVDSIISKVDVVDGIVDDILVDTGTTIPATIATIDTVVDAILVDTAVIGSAGAGLSGVPWNAAWDAEVQSEVADALAAYDPPTKAEMDAMWTTAATESYASDGAAATPAQLLYMILCSVSEFAVSSTTITGKKLDGSTTAMTWTLDDASSPTSRTRAS